MLGPRAVSSLLVGFLRRTPKSIFQNPTPTARFTTPLSLCTFTTTPGYLNNIENVDNSEQAQAQVGTVRDPLSSKLSHYLESQYRLLKQGKHLTFPLEGRHVSMDSVHLRDSCTCPKCIDPSTQQKLFSTQDIPVNITSRKLVVSPEDGTLHVTWSSNFGGYFHKSVYPVNQLKELASLRYATRVKYDDWNYVLWDKVIMETDVQFIPYNDYMLKDDVLFFALEQLVTYGLVFLKGVPDSEDSVAKIAERVGNLKDTFYGRTWDVKSIPNSKNIAYTPLNLGLHMDLLYFESPPGLQFLHCLRNTVTGGESYFADSFRAAEFIRAESINAFSALCKFPITFHYHNDNHHYRFTRPLVVLDQFDYRTQRRIDHVNFSPPFQAPFPIGALANQGNSPTQWRQFLYALKSFSDQVEAQKNRFQLRLGKGEVAIFQNRRVLHARKAFDETSGERWLKGCYVDGDAFRSRLRVLGAMYRKTQGEVDSANPYSYIDRH